MFVHQRTYSKTEEEMDDDDDDKWSESIRVYTMDSHDDISSFYAENNAVETLYDEGVITPVSKLLCLGMNAHAQKLKHNLDQLDETGSSSTLSELSYADQYEDDRSTVTKRQQSERRPSNLIRTGSFERWRLDHLEDQEHSIRRQIIVLSRSTPG